MKNAHSKLIILVFLSLAVLSLANGQKKSNKKRPDRLIETGDLKKVKGTVTAFNNSAVIKNVEVTAKKTRSKALTDSLGRFEFSLPMEDVLIFKAHGFEKNRIKVFPKDDDIIVNLNLKSGEKNEKIAVGYGHMYEEDIPYAFVHSRTKNNNFLNMKDLLQSELAGARVTDQGGIKVFIRDRDFINSTGFSEDNGAALFVLDGMIISDIDFLDPGDVKSVTLLKDPGGTGIYGSHGRNGVVLINTK